MSAVTKNKIQEYATKEAGASDQPAKYYADQYEKYYVRNQAKWYVDWNWYGFIFGPVWLAYRGMFWVAIAITLVLQGLEYLNILFYTIGVLGLSILIGLYGNALYLQHLNFWIKNDTVAKRGVDYTMAILVFILFSVRIVSRLAVHFLHAT